MNTFIFQNGVFLAPVMSVPFLLFSGFFVSFNAIPKYLRWITYLSYIRYGFEGTALATYSFGRENLKCSQVSKTFNQLYFLFNYNNFLINSLSFFFQVYCHFKAPTTTLEELNMQDASFELDISALCVIFLVLRISAFVFLSWKLKSKR